MNPALRRHVVARSVSGYRRLCACYPPAFRARYEEEMVAVFAELCEEAGRQGFFAIGILWCRKLVDAAGAMIGVVPVLSLARVLSQTTRPEAIAIQVSAVFVHCALMYLMARALGRAVAWARLALCLAFASVLVQAVYDRQSFGVLVRSGPAILIGVAQISIPVVMVLAVFGALTRAASPRTL